MVKKRIITSFEKLSPALKGQLQKAYPDGYLDSVRKIDKPNGEFFYAIGLETNEVSYLVKIPVKVDETIDDLDEDLFKTASVNESKSDEMVEFDDDELYDS